MQLSVAEEDEEITTSPAAVNADIIHVVSLAAAERTVMVRLSAVGDGLLGSVQ